MSNAPTIPASPSQTSEDCDLSKGYPASSYLAAILESSDDAIISKDLQGNITTWNQGAEKMFGYTAAEMLGTPILKLIPAELHEEEGHILEKIRSGESVKHFQTMRLRKDGRRLDVSVTISPIRSENGQIIGISKIARDLSGLTNELSLQKDKAARADELEVANKELVFQNEEKGRRADELAVANKIITLAIEAAKIGVWDWDLVNNDIAWDKLMFSIYGMQEHSNGRICYEDWSCHVHPDDLAEQEASLHQTIDTGVARQRVFRIIRGSDHAIRTIQASDAAILGDDGKTIHVVGINLDVTEANLRVEEIRNLNAILKIRAGELEASVKELDSFSYSVSHDLRAPLRAIDGFSRILEEDYEPKLDDEAKRVIGVIRSEARRMGRLIDDLLSFSRLGNQRIEPVTINMHTMAREVFEELVALETGRTIHLNLHPIPPAFGTEAMIRQLWTNLIGNAVKFTGKRDVAEIEIGFTSDESGEEVYFVKDNGAGFDMRHIDKLFGVFQRLHSNEEFPGTGVGLSLVMRIINRHKGRIWGRGEVGKGATFYFTLPKQERLTNPTQQPSTIHIQ